MSWSRGTAIVTSIAQVTQLTGAQGLANLEDDLTATDLLLTASKEIYDRLVRDGLDPTDFAAETIDAFERAVAYTFLHHLSKHGHLGGGDADPERFVTEAERQYLNVRPKSSTNAANMPRSAGESLPSVVNQDAPFFSGGYLEDDTRTIW